jgi:hypothetical protein
MSRIVEKSCVGVVVVLFVVFVIRAKISQSSCLARYLDLGRPRYLDLGRQSHEVQGPLNNEICSEWEL